jgi:hypothetical protein
MPLAVFTAAAGLTAVGVMFGWPWGAVVVAACVLLPLAVVRVLLRLFPVRVLREPAREPLRVVAVRLTPERQPLPVTVPQLPPADHDQGTA